MTRATNNEGVPPGATGLNAARLARPLVVRFGALGDMVQVTALIRQLHARFGVPVDLLSSGSWTRPLFHGQPGVGDIHVLKSRRTPFWLSLDQQRLARRLRARGAGPVWFCEDYAGSGFFDHTGIAPDQMCDAAAFPIRAGERTVERWVRIACATPPAFTGRIEDGTPLVPAVSQLEVGPEQLADCDVWLQGRGLAGRPIVTVHAGNKRTMRGGSRRRRSNIKYWPEDRWGAVLRGVRASDPTTAIVLVGVTQERALNDDIIREANVTDIHNVAGEPPLPTLIALHKRAESMIAVDSGPAHIAAAVGCPVVVLFAAADPTINQPTGPGTTVVPLTGRVDAPGILGITAQAVIEAWRSLPRRSAPAARSAAGP